jgi:outer membrane protein OmpA-like peptidoglycan-associated protein
MSKHRKKTQENYVWLSYSDLATGLMISFILIFIVTNKKTQGYVNDVLKARSAFNKVNKRVVEIITKKKVCDGAIIRQIEDRSETIRISFKDGSKSWFSVNQAKIKKYAERCVKEFGRVWLKQMYLENTQQTVKIQNLIVEGHASSDGEFYHNLSLSQERAFETSKFILQNSSARELGLKRDFSKWSKET